MISKNIKELRLERKLSQNELAKVLNVSLKTISHWESGYTEPSIDMIKKMKEYFNVTYEELLE